jgi:tetratricopeptide (TPR) repeat protein
VRTILNDGREGVRYGELAAALRAAGRMSEAAAAYERSTSVDPDHVERLIEYGTFLLTVAGDREGAAERYRRVLARQPAHREARIRLAHVFKLQAEFAAASALLRALADEAPTDPIVHKELGRLAFAEQQLDVAAVHFKAVIRLNPRDSDAHHWLANIEHLRGDESASRASYRRSIELNPVLRVSSATNPPAFRVLFLFAPGRANTPHDTLIRKADYESRFVLLVPGVNYDAADIGRDAALVVNLISDVDRGHELLEVARSFVDRLALPVVNHPDAVLATDRESIAARLSGIDGCCVPAVRRMPAEGAADAIGQLTWTFPLLVRVAGTHGGEDFERVDDIAAVEAFVDRHRAAIMYLTQYVDYRSPDGYFRKYRFFFVGHEVLPYHLAVGTDWKVHHATTAMADQPWMQREEAAFLAAPESVFEPRHFAALHAIRGVVGLDFLGIDCALGPDGALVVFEVNATMLVHDNTAAYPYKTPAVERIIRAFNALLSRVRDIS